MSDIIKKDICIIGAGPSGLFSAFQAGMLGMNSAVVDVLDTIGGQCTALYPQKPIYDIPAYPSILASELVDKLVEQAQPFAPEYILGQQVIEFSRDEKSKIITLKTSKNTTIECKALIIAAGCGAFGPNRPPMKGLEEYEKTGKVSYLVRDTAEYEGKKIVIAGGGDSAVDWANLLCDKAEKVYMIHRRDKFRAMDDSVRIMKEKVAANKIELIVPYQLDSISGKNGSITTVNVKDFDGNIKNIESDYLLCFFGLSMELGPIANWGLQFTKNFIAIDSKNSKTSLDAVYAVGDIAHFEGKLKLISCGFAEAAMATHQAYNDVFDKPLHFEYSTSKGVAA